MCHLAVGIGAGRRCEASQDEYRAAQEACETNGLGAPRCVSKIAVVTAICNQLATIGDALDSVRSRAWPNVVIDGTRTEGTPELLQARRDGMSVLVSEPDKE